MTTVNEFAQVQGSTGGKVSSKTRSASAELQKYIDQFSNLVQTNNPAGTRKDGCYAESDVSPSLSTKPKPIFSRGKATKSTQKQENMDEDLVQWVNESYAKDLQRKIVPFGQKSSSNADTNSFNEEIESNDDEVSIVSETDPQLSTLPSPGGSVISDVDSNVESLSTDVLVKSFHAATEPPRGKRNHPSWVEELTAAKHYPSWVDEIDETQIRHHDTRNASHSQRNRLSRSLSPSFSHHHPPPPNSPPLLSTSLQEHPRQPRQSKGVKKAIAWDLESTDTEALITESIYGRQPVNMGGCLHSSLYQDRKIRHLHNHSLKKFPKDAERSLLKEMSFAQSYIEEENTRVQSLRPAQRLRNETKTFTSKTTKQKHTNKKLDHPVEGHTPRSFQNDRKQISNIRFSTKRNSSSKERTNTKPFSLKLQRGKGFSSEIRKNSTDSSNTDRLMRQSPTGIDMAKRDFETRNFEEARNKGMKMSTQIRTPVVRHALDVLHSPKAVRTPNVQRATPRRNATQELQRIIDSVEVNDRKLPRERKDYYLYGRVSKKDLAAKDRLPTWNNRRIGDGSKQKNDYTGNTYPTQTDPRNLSPQGSDPTISFKENGSTTHLRSSSSRKSASGRPNPWKSDPTTFVPGTKNRDHRLTSRLRTKSAPNIEPGAWGSLPGRRKRYTDNVPSQYRGVNSGARYANRKPVSDADYVNERVSDADYVNPKITPDADYANERITPDADYANKAIIFGRKNEETESVDTEGLIIKPPMPLFDASPSLTTESAESSGESEDTLIENLALRTSFLATDKSDSELRSSSETQSYLQLPESLRERRIPETRQDWEREDSTRVKTKPGIITSFLEDCLRSSQESIKDEGFPSSVTEEERSMMSEESSERPVETLKQMLFTVQGLARSNEERRPDVNSESFETQTTDSLTEEILSEILSTASHNEGQDSLSRAYYHLARLKRLVTASKEVAAWK